MAQVVHIRSTWQTNVSKRFLRNSIIFLEIMIILSTIVALSMLVCSIAIFKGALSFSWERVTVIGMFGGGIVFFFSFVGLVYVFHIKYKYHREFPSLGITEAFEDNCLQVAKFILCPSSKCVAAMLVLGSVAVMAYLVKQSFFEEKVSSFKVRFTLALISSWTFIGSAAWLYFGCLRSSDKRRAKRSEFQIAGPAVEETDCWEQLKLEELVREVGIQKEIEPEAAVEKTMTKRGNQRLR